MSHTPGETPRTSAGAGAVLGARFACAALTRYRVTPSSFQVTLRPL